MQRKAPIDPEQELAVIEHLVKQMRYSNSLEDHINKIGVQSLRKILNDNKLNTQQKLDKIYVGKNLSWHKTAFLKVTNQTMSDYDKANTLLSDLVRPMAKDKTIIDNIQVLIQENANNDIKKRFAVLMKDTKLDWKGKLNAIENNPDYHDIKTEITRILLKEYNTVCSEHRPFQENINIAADARKQKTQDTIEIRQQKDNKANAQLNEIIGWVKEINDDNKSRSLLDKMALPMRITQYEIILKNEKLSPAEKLNRIISIANEIYNKAEAKYQTGLLPGIHKMIAQLEPIPLEHLNESNKNNNTPTKKGP